MRIISKFHDFYDIGMQYGQDEDLVWVRETEPIKMDLAKLDINNCWFREFKPWTKSYWCAVERAPYIGQRRLVVAQRGR